MNWSAHPAVLLAWVNLRHFSHAIFGVGCRFIPQTEKIGGLQHKYGGVPVLEYRGMSLVILVCVLLAKTAEYEGVDGLLALIACCWLLQSVRRAWTFRSPLVFYRKVWGESKTEWIAYSYLGAVLSELNVSEGLPSESSLIQERDAITAWLNSRRSAEVVALLSGAMLGRSDRM